MTKNYTIDHVAKKIVLPRAFNKKAKNPMLPEFDELVTLLNKLPDYNLSLKASRQKAGKKLTFMVMREYIRKTYGENSIMEKNA